MRPQLQAMQLAMANGLTIQWDAFSQSFYFMNVGDLHQDEVLLWSSFWRALANALGHRNTSRGRMIGRRFWEWVMDGKSPDDFFKALLAERRAE